MVIWSQPAKADLKHIHDFITEDSKHYTRKVAQAIREKPDSLLNELPNAGKMVPEIGNPAIRELHIYSYRILLHPTKITPAPQADSEALWRQLRQSRIRSRR